MHISDRANIVMEHSSFKHLAIDSCVAERIYM